MVEDTHEKMIRRPYPPLGLLYLGTYLRANGFKPTIYDSTFSTWENLQAYLRKNRPRLVGIYTNLITRKRVLDIIQVAREIDAWVILGGPESANYPQEYLNAGAHIIVIGEGELTLLELLRCFEKYQEFPISCLKEIPGLIFQKDEQYIRTPPRTPIAALDCIPIPDRDLIPMQPYLDTWKNAQGYTSLSLITARGCPYRCNWCSHAVFGYSHRRRSPENVLAEVQYLKEKYDPDCLWYADDVFTIHTGWIQQFASLLKKHGLRIPFETISREDRLNESIIQLLSEMGCKRLWIGAESGSQRILNAMERRTRAERIPYLTSLLRAYGIESGLFIMLGYDEETWDDINQTYRMLREARPNIFLHTVAYPIKGTPFYDRIAPRLIIPGPWSTISDRQLRFLGRPSRIFYRFTSLWLTHSLAVHNGRAFKSKQPNGYFPFSMMVHLFKALIGRIGMWVFRTTQDHDKHALEAPVTKNHQKEEERYAG